MDLEGIYVLQSISRIRIWVILFYTTWFFSYFTTIHNYTRHDVISSEEKEVVSNDKDEEGAKSLFKNQNFKKLYAGGVPNAYGAAEVFDNVPRVADIKWEHCSRVSSGGRME